MFHHGHPKHLAGRGTVDVLSGGKGCGFPLLSGHPGNDPCLNGREVRDHKLHPLTGHKGGPNQLGQHIRHRIIEQLQCLVVPLAHHLPGFRKVRQMVLGKILQLYESATVSRNPNLSVPANKKIPG